MNKITKEKGTAKMNLKIELNMITKFYTNGEDWLIEIGMYDCNENKIHAQYYQLSTTHNNRFNESFLAEISFGRFDQITRCGVFKEIEMDSRIDWTKMKIQQEKIDKEED